MVLYIGIYLLLGLFITALMFKKIYGFGVGDHEIKIAMKVKEYGSESLNDFEKRSMECLLFQTAVLSFLNILFYPLTIFILIGFKVTK